jgi:hypothetical protein
MEPEAAHGQGCPIGLNFGFDHLPYGLIIMNVEKFGNEQFYFQEDLLLYCSGKMTRIRTVNAFAAAGDKIANLIKLKISPQRRP